MRAPIACWPRWRWPAPALPVRAIAGSRLRFGRPAPWLRSARDARCCRWTRSRFSSARTTTSTTRATLPITVTSIPFTVSFSFTFTFALSIPLSFPLTFAFSLAFTLSLAVPAARSTSCLPTLHGIRRIGRSSIPCRWSAILRRRWRRRRGQWWGFLLHSEFFVSFGWKWRSMRRKASTTTATRRCIRSA